MQTFQKTFTEADSLQVYVSPNILKTDYFTPIHHFKIKYRPKYPMYYFNYEVFKTSK